MPWREYHWNGNLKEEAKSGRRRGVAGREQQVQRPGL